MSGMRNRHLHTAVFNFVEEAAWQLASDVTSGEDEIGFELDAIGGKRRTTALYCYRPLTADFIDRRLSVLDHLPSYVTALHALEHCGGLEEYLMARGESRSADAAHAGARGRAAETLRCLLAQTFEGSTDFVLSRERFDRVYEEFESLVLDGRALTEVVATISGLVLGSSRVELADGLTLLGADALPDAPALALQHDPTRRAPILIRLAWEAAPGDEAPLRHAHVRLRRLLLALRLYDSAHVSLGRNAWQRVGGGSWQPFALTPVHSMPVEQEGVCAVPPEQEDELRAFISLVFRRTPRNGELAWALRRFELACERPTAAEKLTDVLLSLRALLEPEGAHSGQLPGRLAVLCAVPERRALVAERAAHMISLERSIVAGLGPDEQTLTPLVDELTDWLRALLRDVLCGHLGQDLYNVADELVENEVRAVS